MNRYCARGLAGIMVLILVARTSICGQAASPPASPASTCFLIGPPITPRPAGFNNWSREQRLESLIRSRDQAAFLMDFSAGTVGGEFDGLVLWGFKTIQSANADPLVPLAVAHMYELTANGSSVDANHRYELMRRATVYRLINVSMTFVDASACDDDGAGQESIVNSMTGAKNALAWLKTVSPAERDDVVQRALAAESASWGKRAVSLSLCWNSRDALMHTDPAKQKNVGTKVENGVTVTEIYLPTVAGWLPALRPDAEKRRIGIHNQVAQILTKITR